MTKHMVLFCVCLLCMGTPITSRALTHEELQWQGFSDRIIDFSGYRWRAKNGGIFGPGSNYFSDSDDNIRVDENGWLHLKITKRDGKWYCPEIVLVDALGYGDYIFKTVGRVDDIDPNTIIGMFLWEYKQSYLSNDVYNGANEFDIEFGTWKDPMREPAQFVCQPWQYPGNEHRFDLKLDSKDAKISTAFLWQPSGVACRCWYGHADIPEPSEIIHDWFYAGPHIPRNEEPRVHINYWCIEEPPSDGQEKELILAEFKFIPCSKKAKEERKELKPIPIADDETDDGGEDRPWWKKVW